MSTAIYIATTEKHSGKSLVSLGILRMLLNQSSKVGYFRPIIDDIKDDLEDNHIKTALDFFDLNLEYDDCYALKRSEAIELLKNGKTEDLIDAVIDKYKVQEQKFEYVLVEGSDFIGEGTVVELDINIALAKNLNLPVIIVGKGSSKTLKEFTNSIQLAYHSFKEKEVEIIGVVANKIDKENVTLVKDVLQEAIGNDVNIDVIHKISELNAPTLKEVVYQVGGNVLIGKDYLTNTVQNFSTGAMQLRNFLIRLKKDSLVVTPGDRADIILGSLQANHSQNYPKISGIVLTGGLIPEPSILKLIEGLNTTVPIISSEQGTFAVTNLIGNIKSKIYSGNEKKILASLEAFDTYVNTKSIRDKLTTYSSTRLTPRMFQYNLLQKAKSVRKHIVLPEGNDIRILKAVDRLIALGVVDITLIGNKEEIERKSLNEGLKIDFSKLQILDSFHSKYNKEFSEALYEARKHKGLTQEVANDLVTDVSYFGTLMVHLGYADGMVSGAVHTTQHTIKPALQLIKTKPGMNVVSSVFFMCLEDRVSVMGDCAVNPKPTAEQLAEIAITSAQSSLSFGIEPRVAMLSYSSGASGKGEEVEKVRRATEIVKESNPEIKIEGPIQYDAAVDISIAKSKMPNSEVAGQASVLIFPDLNTGNNTYKAIQRETGALAIGPLLQGLNKPVNDLSRGCTTEDVYNTILLTAVQAQQK